MSRIAKLLAKTSESLERVKYILRLIDENRTHFPYLDEILNKPLLLKMKDAFEKKYIPLLNKLSHSLESTAGSAGSESTEDKEGIEIKRISQNLSDLTRDLDRAQEKLDGALSEEGYKEHLQSILSSKELEHAELRAKFELLSPLFERESLNNEAYKRFILTKKAYETQLRRFSESPKNISDYDLMILQSQQLLDAYQQVIHLAEAYRHYKLSYDEAQILRIEWQEMMGSDALEELKKDVPGSKLCKKIKDFQQQLASLEQRFNKTGDTAKTLMDTSQALRIWISDLRKTKLALLTEMKARVRITKAEMEKTQQTFMALYHEVTVQMHQISAVTTEVDALSTQFNECFSSRSPSDDDVLFHIRKSLELRSIVDKLKKVIEQKTGIISEKMRERTQILQDTTIEAYQELLEKYDHIKHLIPSDKIHIFEDIISRLTDLEATQATDDLKSLDYQNLIQKYQKLFDDRLEFDTRIQEAEELIRFYTTIATLLKQIDTSQQEHFINTLKDALDQSSGSALLSALDTQLIKKGKYNKVKKWILDSIGAFSPNGLTALNTYFEDKIGSDNDTVQIKEKIAFIKLLTEHQISASSYLKDIICVAGVLYLKSQQVLNPDLHLTKATLENTSFWNTINIFKNLELNINSSIVQALLDSADLCAIINNQYDRYGSLDTNHLRSLKAFISKAINQDTKVIESLIAINKCPSLNTSFNAATMLPLLAEDAKLREIFVNTPQETLVLASSFLKHLFQHAPNDIDSVNGYFLDKQRANAEFTSYLRKNAELIQNLQNALKNPASHRLNAMMKLFEKFNTWSSNYVERLPEKEQQKMVGFREAMAPILLSTASDKEKQQRLEALAKQHFAPKFAGLINLLDVLMTITGLFLLISPLLRIGSKHAFFFSQLRTNPHKEVHQQLTDLNLTPQIPVDGMAQEMNGAGTGIQTTTAGADPEVHPLDKADDNFASLANDPPTPKG